MHKADSRPLFFEFWIKTVSDLKNFFSITDLTSEDTLIKISKGELGFITTPLNEMDLARNDIYLSNSTWNYFGLLFDEEGTDLNVTFYINSKVACSKIIKNKSLQKKLSFNFQANSVEKEFEIDRVRLTKLGDNLNHTLNNKHFLNFEADSSQVLAKLNFDEKSELTNYKNNDKLNVKSVNTEFRKSDAPIFSRAPKLTVSIGSSYNSIVWYVQEYYTAKEFVLEKSTNKGSFNSVYKNFADDDPLKIYYFTDELLAENDAVFYRLKQINKDGSEVYSAEVKIGNKKVEEFDLKQNYPNPFNPITNIYVEVIIPSKFEVNVYDLVGNQVAQLHDGYLSVGMQTFEFDASKLPSGIYFYEVLSPKSHAVKKMILAK